MNYILQIDTSGNTGCIALSQSGKLVASSTNTTTRDHASVIHGMIEEVFRQCQINFHDLKGVAVCAGPGSYTGLRIGMSIAKGICYPLNIPIMPHNKIRLLAYQEVKLTENQYENYAVILKAREKEYFMGIYDKEMKEILAPMHLRHNICEENIINQKGNLLIITDLEDIKMDSLKSNLISLKQAGNINLETWSHIAFSDLSRNNVVDLVNAEPFYLKEVFINK